jgi:hypothetical protein
MHNGDFDSEGNITLTPVPGEVPEVKSFTITPKVGLQNLMAEAAREMKCSGVTMGFQVANAYLVQIAERALVLNDEPLIELLQNIGVLTSEN